METIIGYPKISEPGVLVQSKAAPESSADGVVNPSPLSNIRGGPLNDGDYQALVARWIDRDWADQQMLRRVISIDGAEILGTTHAQR